MGMEISRPTFSTPFTVVIAVLLLRTVLLFVGGFAAAAITGTGYGDALLYSNAHIVITDLITLAVLAVLLKRQDRTLMGLFTPKLRDTGWGLLAFLISLVAFFIATFIGNLVAYQGPPPLSGNTWDPPLWLGIWSLTIMPITIALAEEGLYRGWATDELTGRLGRVPTLLVVAFFFAIQHTALTPFDLQAQIARVITTFGAGVAFGLLRWWLKRLWPLVIAHWLLDLVGLGIPMLAASLS